MKKKMKMNKKEKERLIDGKKEKVVVLFRYEGKIISV